MEKSAALLKRMALSTTLEAVSITNYKQRIRLHSWLTERAGRLHSERPCRP